MWLRLPPPAATGQGDRTYTFVTDLNGGYVQANLADPALFRSMKINYLLFYNASGSLVPAGYNLEDGTRGKSPGGTDTSSTTASFPKILPEGRSGAARVFPPERGPADPRGSSDNPPGSPERSGRHPGHGQAVRLRPDQRYCTTGRPGYICPPGSQKSATGHCQWSGPEKDAERLDRHHPGQRLGHGRRSIPDRH